MSRLTFSVLTAMLVMAGCAAPPDPSAPAQVYEERDLSIGSNIPSRQRRAAATPEERDRARAEAEAIRNSQTRATMPRSAGTP